MRIIKNILGPYRIDFVSADCAEPVHVHVTGDGSLKIWLDTFETSQVKGFSPREVRKIVRLIRKHEARIRHVWNDFCP